MQKVLVQLVQVLLKQHLREETETDLFGEQAGTLRWCIEINSKWL